MNDAENNPPHKKRKVDDSCKNFNSLITTSYSTQQQKASFSNRSVLVTIPEDKVTIPTHTSIGSNKVRLQRSTPIQ